MNVLIAVLAAGASRRLGRPKQLVVLAGETLIHRAARVALGAPAAEVAIVVGAHRDAVVAEVADLPVTAIDNPNWETGMASSIVAATSWAIAGSADALLIMLCDQPRLPSAHLGALIATQASLAASFYGGRRGAPAIFARRHFSELLTLSGDRGAGALLGARDVAEVPWEDGAFDVDVAADVAGLSA